MRPYVRLVLPTLSPRLRIRLRSAEHSRLMFECRVWASWPWEECGQRIEVLRCRSNLGRPAALSCER